jgi:hypothetical protein
MRMTGPVKNIPSMLRSPFDSPPCAVSLRCFNSGPEAFSPARPRRRSTGRPYARAVSGKSSFPASAHPDAGERHMVISDESGPTLGQCALFCKKNLQKNSRTFRIPQGRHSEFSRSSNKISRPGNGESRSTR